MQSTFEELPINTTTNASAFFNSKAVTSPSIIPLLMETKVKDLVDSSRKLVKTSYEEDVSSLMRKLSDANVLSAVVVDNGRAIGFVDVLDVMAFLLDITSNSTDITKESIQNLKWEGTCFGIEKSGALLNLSQNNPFYSVTMDTSLWKVVEYFSQEVHRVGVMSNGDLVNVIAQSDIIQFLAYKGVWIGTKMEQSVLDSGISTLGAVTVDMNTNTLEAIKTLRTFKISGVAVVDMNGRLVANFSASDLLAINKDNFSLITLPIWDFICKTHLTPKPPVYARPSDSVEVVLLKMCVHKIHRVFIVDQHMIPIGVVTMTDLMKWLVTVGTSD